MSPSEESARRPDQAPDPPATRSDGPAPDDDESQQDRMARFFDSAAEESEPPGMVEEGEDDLLIVRDMGEEMAMAQVLQERTAEEAGAVAEPAPAAADSTETGAAPPADDPVKAEAKDEESGALEGLLDNSPPARKAGPAMEASAASTAEAGPPEADPLAATPPTRRRPRAPRRTEPPLAALLATVSGLFLFVAGTVLALMKIEPAYTWYYVFAWYPFLLTVNFATALHSRAHSIFPGRLRPIAGMLAWSVPVWLVFEVLNLRLQDWYYINVPQNVFARQIGVILSFATVLPGVLLLEEALRVCSVFRRARSRPFGWTERIGRIVLGVGVAWAALVLVAPRLFFPLVWGVPVLLLEPWLRRAGGPSLARDLSEGKPGRVLRLLVAGTVCGLWWEAANAIGGGKWIYTVPGLDALRPFEMPALGFVGFAPFALCLWSMARALVRLGVLPDWERVGANLPPPPAPAFPAWRRRVPGIAAVFTVAALAAVGHWTVDSTTARVADVPGVPDGVPEYARQQGKDSVRGLIQLIERGDLYIPGESNAALLDQLEKTCRLILLQGIGADNARRLDLVGVRGVADLAARDPEQLNGDLAALGERGWSPHPRRVAAWVSAARKVSPEPALLLIEETPPGR